MLTVYLQIMSKLKLRLLDETDVDRIVSLQILLMQKERQKFTFKYSVWSQRQVLFCRNITRTLECCSLTDS